MTKVWVDLDDDFERIDQSGKYYYIDLGVQVIDPSEIVSLSRTLDEVKLERLRESIRKDGWRDISPRDINLIIMPEGIYKDKYVVSNGGNHRAAVSNEFGIKQIKADIGAYVDKKSLTSEEENLLQSKEEERSRLFMKLQIEKDENEGEIISNSIREINEFRDELLRGIYYRSKNTEN